MNGLAGIISWLARRDSPPGGSEGTRESWWVLELCHRYLPSTRSHRSQSIYAHVGKCFEPRPEWKLMDLRPISKHIALRYGCCNVAVIYSKNIEN